MCDNPNKKDSEKTNTSNKKLSEYLENEVASLYSTLGMSHDYPNKCDKENPNKKGNKSD